MKTMRLTSLQIFIILIPAGRVRWELGDQYSLQLVTSNNSKQRVRINSPFSILFVVECCGVIFVCKLHAQKGGLTALAFYSGCKINNLQLVQPCRGFNSCRLHTLSTSLFNKLQVPLRNCMHFAYTTRPDLTEFGSALASCILRCAHLPLGHWVQQLD